MEYHGPQNLASGTEPTTSLAGITLIVGRLNINWLQTVDGSDQTATSMVIATSTPTMVGTPRRH